jgi:secernin
VQNLEVVPARDHHAGDTVKCTYIEIPQVSHTHEVFLSKPYWIWGAEMGVNEHGVCIGNEAIFTRIKPRKENKYLLGMDLLRLGLERGSTAKEALDTIIALLVKHGQGGNHGHAHKAYYNNEYVIADQKEAYVLVIIDRMWAWKRVTTAWTISNVISLTNDFDEISDDMVQLAFKKGLARNKETLDLKKAFSAGFMTRMAVSEDRRACTFSAVQKSDLQVLDVMDALRSHGIQDSTPGYNPVKNSRISVCAHATGLTSPSQTTGSMVAWIPRSNAFHVFATGSSTPCVSPFKLVYSKNARLPAFYIAGAKQANLGSYWWRCEKAIHVAMLQYQAYIKEVVPERRRLEQEMVAKALQDGGSQAIADESFIKADALLEGFARQHERDAPELAAKKGVTFLRKMDAGTGLHGPGH